jgi:hypothetical protein
MKIKKDYKIWDKVRVVSYNKDCCSECDKVAAYFEKHKPIGTIIYAGTGYVDINFDEPQDIDADGVLTSNWSANYKFIQPAGPISGEQRTFVFTGPDSRCEVKDTSQNDFKVDKPTAKKKVKKKKGKNPAELWPSYYTKYVTPTSSTITGSWQEIRLR